jgi:RND family efflux transporter MFP subunit
MISFIRYGNLLPHHIIDLYGAPEPMSNALPAYKCTWIWLLPMSLILLSACSKQEEVVEEVIRPAKIVTVGDAMGEAIRNFPGEVKASDKAIQSFRVSGEVTELPAVAGQPVQKGDILAKLDPKDYKLAYDDNKARFELAKVQFKRAEEIWAKRLIARADYDKAKTRYLAAKASYEQAEANLEYTILRAPFDGVISKVHVDKFVNVQAKDPIVNIQSKDTVDVTFQVPENVVARIQRGEGKKAKIAVTFPSHPAQSFPAEAKEFDTEADPQTQTFKAVVTIPIPTTFTVLEGMSTTVQVDLSELLKENNNKLVLPVTAVFAAEEQPVETSQRYVWRVDPESMRVSRQAVSVGQLTEGGIEVVSGVEPGQQVIAAGVNFVKEGQKVKRWERERGL